MARLTYAGASGFWRDAAGTLFYCGTGLSQKPMLYRVPPDRAAQSFARSTWLEYGQQFVIEPLLVLVYAAADSETPFWVLLFAYALFGRPALQGLLVLRGLGKTGIPAPLETKLEPFSRSNWWRIPAALIIAALILIYLSNTDRPLTWDSLWPNLVGLGILGLARIAERAVYRRKLARMPA
ncbi:MAG: hypothetical protein WDN69_13940 [Aliidongia sp.]